MNISTMNPRRPDHIQLTALSPTEGIVRDGRMAESDARSLVGFIQKAGGQYEVMEFGEQVRISFLPTFEGALTVLISPRLTSRRQRRSGPLVA
jgi:hypothetical protein